MLPDERTVHQRDQGWSWMILFQACYQTLINDGFRMSLGIFYSQFLDTTEMNKAQVALVVGVVNAMFMLPGPLASFLVGQLGARPTAVFGSLIAAGGLLASAFCSSFWALFFSFGVAVGLGCCFSFLTFLGVLPPWFEKHRQLAPALVMACGGLGIFVMAPTIQLLVDTYSWRGAVIVLAGFMLQGVISGTALFPVKTQQAPNLRKSRADTMLLCTNPSYWLHLVAGFLMFGVPLFFIFIVRHVTAGRGFSEHEAAFLVSICGIASFAGRMSIVLSLVVKKSATKNTRIFLYNTSAFFGSLCCLLIGYLWDYYAVAVTCGVMGFMQGIRLGSMVGVTIDVTGPKLFQQGYGYFHLTGGLSVVTFPPLAGLLAEHTGSYDAVFYLSSAALLGSFVLGCILHFLEYRKETRRPSISNEQRSLKDQSDSRGRN